MFLTGYSYGIVPIAYSLLLVQSSGAEINLQNKTYRKVYSMNFGKWKPLPEIEYVSVFATNKSTRVWASSASGVINDGVYMINLFYDTNKKIEVCEVDIDKDAFYTGAHIAYTLETDLLDATEANNYKWMNRDIYLESGKKIYED